MSASPLTPEAWTALVTRIHVFFLQAKNTWMTATSAGKHGHDDYRGSQRAG